MNTKSVRSTTSWRSVSASHSGSLLANWRAELKVRLATDATV